jgi:hypothetical protein
MSEGTGWKRVKKAGMIRVALFQMVFRVSASLWSVLVLGMDTCASLSLEKLLSMVVLCYDFNMKCPPRLWCWGLGY